MLIVREFRLGHMNLRVRLRIALRRTRARVGTGISRYRDLNARLRAFVRQEVLGFLAIYRSGRACAHRGAVATQASAGVRTGPPIARATDLNLCYRRRAKFD
jgi:hypothetical protein